MFDTGSVVADTVLSCFVIIVFHLIWDHFSEKRAKARRMVAEEFYEQLHELCSLDTAIVSLSQSENGPVTVCVIDEWTGYSEECFIQDNMESAVQDALKYKNSRKR